MLRALLRRIAFALITALGITVVSFLAIHARPDDTLRRLAASAELAGGVPADLAHLRAVYGLDRPVHVRLGRWLADALRGDLGESWSRPGRSVTGVLADHAGATLALTGSGLLLQLVVGVALAGFALRRRGTWGDGALQASGLALHAIPQFCVGLLLLWPLAFKLGWFPTSGAASRPWESDPGVLDRLHHLALPALCLGLGGAIVVCRLLLVRWGDELAGAHVLAARARGAAERRVVWRHALPMATGPLCAAIGLSLPALFGGAVIVERVFSWPGLGTVLLDAVRARDLPLLAGANLIFALLVSLGGMLSDVAWLLVDPRVKLR